MIDKKLNLTETILNNLPIIKEYFIKFYGEEYREVIEKKFDNCTYIGYCLPDNLKLLLIELNKNKSKELIELFFENNDIEVNEKNIRNYFGNANINLEFLSNSNLQIIYNGLDDGFNSEYQKMRFLEAIRKISENETLVFDSDEYNIVLDKIKKMRDSYDDIVIKFREFQDKYVEYKEYIDECQKLESKINNKYKIKYLKEIYKFLDDHDREVIDNAIMTGSSLRLYNLNCSEVLCCSWSYSGKALVDSFSSKSVEKLNSTNAKEYEIKSILDDRINYFKKKGIDLGDNYETYKNDKRCRDLVLDALVVDELIQVRDKLKEQEQEEYITSTSQYQNHLKEIESLGLLDKEISYNYKEVSLGIIGINPNIRLVDGEVQLYNLMLFSGGCLNDYFDACFIHECNHLMETELISVDDKKYVVRSGFEFLTGGINESFQEVETEKRKFEDLNEIINELLAQEIHEMINRDGIYFFDDKETSKIRGGTSYEKSRFLVQDFYNIYKDDIKRSRITGDMACLYDKVGKENLLELNNLVRDFSSYFDNFKIYSLIKDIENKIMTDNVKFYRECLERRDRLIMAMNEFCFNKGIFVK